VKLEPDCKLNPLLEFIPSSSIKMVSELNQVSFPYYFIGLQSSPILKPHLQKP